MTADRRGRPLPDPAAAALATLVTAALAMLLAAVLLLAACGGSTSSSSASGTSATSGASGAGDTAAATPRATAGAGTSSPAPSELARMIALAKQDGATKAWWAKVPAATAAALLGGASSGSGDGPVYVVVMQGDFVDEAQHYPWAVVALGKNGDSLAFKGESPAAPGMKLTPLAFSSP